jgi:hypothetical protein
VDWDVERFLDRIKTTQIQLDNIEDEPARLEERLRKFFPESERNKLSQPTVVVDVHGRILLWYLPSILAISQVVQLRPFYDYCTDCFVFFFMKEHRERGCPFGGAPSRKEPQEGTPLGK